MLRGSRKVEFPCTKPGSQEIAVNISSIKTIIEKILSTPNHGVKILLQDLIEEASYLYNFDVLNSYGFMTALWHKLFDILCDGSASEVQLLSLDALRILTRDHSHFKSVLTEEKINILLGFANISDDKNTAVEADSRTIAALKCLYNIIYNSRGCDVLQVNIDQNCIHRILCRAEVGDSHLMSQIKLFDMKVLFLVTALHKDVCKKMKEQHGIKHLIKKLEYVQDSTNLTSTNSDVEIICEILKILFNLSLYLTEDKEDQESCFHLVQLLRCFLLVTDINDQSKVKLHSNVINLLTNMPNSSFVALVTEVEGNENVQNKYKYEKYNVDAIFNLVEFLQNLFVNSTKRLDDLAPILTVLLKSAGSVRIIRKYLRLKILPPLQDVHKRPEEGDTLRNQLCRLLTNPTNVGQLAASLIFVLCRENVDRMIKYTGYGNAAGLLAQLGLLTGGNRIGIYSSDSEDSDTEEYKQHREGINPVVGCVEPPHPNPVDNMTDEQKEHEIMQLVNLMDSLSRKGIVKPCKIGEDGTLQPVEHILELQESLPVQQVRSKKADE